MSEPEPITVKRWRCPYCHRSRSSRTATAEHIGRCWLNPAVRACKTCANYEYEPGGICGAPPPHFGCEDGSENCAAGIDLTGEFPKTGCRLWAASHLAGEEMAEFRPGAA